MGVDPLRTFGSGSLLAAVPEGSTDGALAELERADVEAALVGTVRESREPVLDLGGERFVEPVRDDMYALWE
jgi:hydrogenase expression/formation protein HypE